MISNDLLGPNVTPSKDMEMDTPSNYLVPDKGQLLAAELNPFEQSFANPRPQSAGNGTDTPKPALPSVIEMFTPGGTNQYEAYAFPDSLRHGPLSPNLLSGPQGIPFDPSTFRTGLTPNESNIRTGLTPGNTPGFSLLPTPGTAALLAPYTPNTAAALASMSTTTFPVQNFNPAPPPPPRSDVFGENQAANGLVFLAQTSQQQAQAQNIPPPNAPTREELVKRAAVNNSKMNAYQDPSNLMNNNIKKVEEPPKNTRSKRGSSKAEETNNTNGKETSTATTATSGKKGKSKSTETDDEKRRNFLERNRQGTSPS